MKQLSTNLVQTKYSIEPVRKLSLNQHFKRGASILENNIETLKLGQRDFNDRVEDNQMRKQKMSQHLQDFQNCVSAFETPSPKQTKETRKQNITEAMQIAEKMLGYLNIDIAVQSQHVSDSAMEIEPIKDPESLLQVLKYLLPRLANFPYSFLSQVKLRNIHFCYDVHQNNPKHAAIYRQKLVNGLMPIGRLKTDDKIMKHLCRILMFNMCKNVPEFANSWKEFLCDDNSEKSMHEDLAETFYMLLRVNEGKRIPAGHELEVKIGELRSRLKAFDPAGINYEWSHHHLNNTNSDRRDSLISTTSTNQDKENDLFLTSNMAANHKW